MEDVSVGACGTAAADCEFDGGSATFPEESTQTSPSTNARKARRRGASPQRVKKQQESAPIDPPDAESNGHAASAEIVAVASYCEEQAAEPLPDREECAGSDASATAEAVTDAEENAETAFANAATEERVASEPVAESQTADAPAESCDISPLVEALLFSTDSPLSARKLSELTGAGGVAAVQDAIAQLNQRYESVHLTFRIEKIAEGYQMLTLPAYQPWVSKLDKQRADHRLTDAALETLAIVAYRQPIIRADIEAIRGVACGEVLNRLRELGLVRTAGRAEVVGRPLLYGTTKKFLDLFGLAGLEELPSMETARGDAGAGTVRVEGT